MKNPGSVSYCAILNPASHSGRTGKRRTEIIEAIKSLSDAVTISVTEAPGDARRFAFEAAGRYDVVIAIGGDGTVNGVAAGLLEKPSKTALAVVPAGTGNDFARMIGMPDTLIDAVEVISSAVRVIIDAGQISWNDGDTRESASFVNAVGIGFDGYAASLAPRYKHLPLGSGYLVTVLDALFSWDPFQAIITDPVADGKIFYDGDVFMLTVSNARDSGGGFRINPRASLTDNLLDACLVKGVGMNRAIQLLPRAARGSHLGLDEVEYWQLPAVRIKTGTPVPVHADGEILTLGTTDITVEIRVAALTVLVPGKMRSELLSERIV